jgi:DNA polymerase III delta prime subunit
LFEILSGIKKRPLFLIIYGSPGVGKSQLASQFGESIFFDMENGTDFLNVNRVKINSFDSLVEGIKWFTDQKADTLILDSLTAIEKLSVEKVLQETGKESIEEMKYAEGHRLAAEKTNRVINGCKFLRSKGKNVVLVAHTVVRDIKGVDSDGYNRIEFDCYKTLTTTISSEVDGCFYMRPVVRQIGDKKKRAVTSGARELLMSDQAGALSKSRLSHMPPTYEFEFEETADKINAQYKSFWEKVTHV